MRIDIVVYETGKGVPLTLASHCKHGIEPDFQAKHFPTTGGADVFTASMMEEAVVKLRALADAISACL